MLVLSPSDNWSRDLQTLIRMQQIANNHVFVNREIQENKEQTVEAMHNVHNVLNAFQEEFQNRLRDLGEDLTRQLTAEADIFRETWKHNHERM